MNFRTVDTIKSNSGLHASEREPQTFELYALCYHDRFELLPDLTATFVNSGGWVLERHTISAVAMEFLFELQLSGIVEVYGAFLELTRDSHATLTDLCTCHQHVRYSTSPTQILTFRLQIQFLADTTLHSALMASRGCA